MHRTAEWSSPTGILAPVQYRSRSARGGFQLFRGSIVDAPQYKALILKVSAEASGINGLKSHFVLQSIHCALRLATFDY